MGVGSRLKTILKEKPMTIKALSDKTGIPVNTLYSITKRDDQNVRSDNLEKIAAALDVDVDYLLKGEAPKNGYSGELDLDGVTIEEMHALAEKIRETTKQMIRVGDYWQKIHDIMKVNNVTLTDFKRLIVEFGALLDSYKLSPSQFFDILDKLDEVGFFDPQGSAQGGKPDAQEESPER